MKGYANQVNEIEKWQWFFADFIVFVLEECEKLLGTT
jgi:hypothetical protein